MRALKQISLLASSVFLLAAASLPVRAADIGFQKTLTVTGPVALHVCSNSGTIHIAGMNGSSVQISAKIHKSNWHAFGNADDMKKVAANPPIHQTGNSIQIGDSNTCGGSVLHNIDIDYEISLPKNSTVVAKSGAGNIHVESIHGFVRAGTGAGDIIANDIGDGSIFSTGSGTLDVQAAHGTVRAETGSGNLSLRDSDVTHAVLTSGSGNITVSNLKGGLRANTGNGSLTIGGNPTSDWEMRTGNGAIHFHADPNAKFTLDAETGNGAITSSLPSPVSGHVTTGMMGGPVRGGGPDVKMYTGNGSIDLN